MLRLKREHLAWRFMADVKARSLVHGAFNEAGQSSFGTERDKGINA